MGRWLPSNQCSLGSCTEEVTPGGRLEGGKEGAMQIFEPLRTSKEPSVAEAECVSCWRDQAVKEVRNGSGVT